MIAGASDLLRALHSTPAPACGSRGRFALLEGRSIYLSRCATCHGQEGRGDGPIAGSLLGPPVGNISDGKWKHGGKPEEVLGVISKGIEGTRMTGWGQVLEPSQLRAVTAYVFYLARQPVQAVLRQSASDQQ